MRYCTMCWHEKEEADFVGPDKTKTYKTCTLCRTRQARSMGRSYDIDKVKATTTSDLVKELARNHAGKCGICTKEVDPTKLELDHDYKTGMVRGLLCKTCNIGLGMFKDDVGLLLKAVEYVSKDYSGSFLYSSVGSNKHVMKQG